MSNLSVFLVVCCIFPQRFTSGSLYTSFKIASPSPFDYHMVLIMRVKSGGSSFSLCEFKQLGTAGIKNGPHVVWVR